MHNWGLTDFKEYFVTTLLQIMLAKSLRYYNVSIRNISHQRIKRYIFYSNGMSISNLYTNSLFSIHPTHTFHHIKFAKFAQRLIFTASSTNTNQILEEDGPENDDLLMKELEEIYPSMISFLSVYIKQNFNQLFDLFCVIAEVASHNTRG